MMEKNAVEFENFQKEVIEEIKEKAQKEGDKEMQKVAEEMEADLSK